MKNKNIKLKVVEYFFRRPTQKLRVRQIEREVGVPLPSAIRYANELESETLLKSEIIAGIKLYSANRTSKKYLFEKKIYNLRTLQNSNLFEYLVEETSNPIIILFGSYGRGEDIEDSDIDLYIGCTKKIYV